MTLFQKRILLSPQQQARHVFVFFVLACLSGVFLTACQDVSTDGGIVNRNDSADQARWVEQSLAQMSRREMVSQMIVVLIPDEFDAFDAQAFNELRENVIDFGAGGIVFLQSEPLSQSTITSDLQAEARIPLFVAQDMEWGAAMRVKYATEFPQAMGIGATQDPEFAREAGRITAVEARSLGVNFILAPVADVNSNPDNPIIGPRSFGDDPEQVSLFVSAFIHGVQKENILATVKHFPGHGSTNADSHSSLPLVAPERFQTELLDLKPFKAAISSNVGAVMTGHVAIARPGDRNIIPATLSDSLLHDVLRVQLGFRGLIISDAMNMAGLGNLGKIDSITVRAVRAGVDILLMPRDPVETREIILRALADGTISETRIRASVRRILLAKWSIGLSKRPASRLHSVRSELTNPDHKAFSRELARRSLVLLDDGEALDRITSARSITVLPVIDVSSGDHVRFLRRSLERYHSGIVMLDPILEGPIDEVLRSITDRPDRGNIVIIADLRSSRRSAPAFLESIVNVFSGKDVPLIVLAMGSPYSAAGLEAGKHALIVSFGSSRVVSDAVADALFGRSTICGHLPVQLSDQFKRGSGLCRPQKFLRRGLPEESGLSGDILRSLAGLIDTAIADTAFPGAAIAIGRAGVLVEFRGFGHYRYDASRNVTPKSIFDLASLTKVIATTTAIMKLYEADAIRLDDPVSRYIPAFGESGKSAVTIRHLLTHTGGLIPFRPYYQNSRASSHSVISEILGDSLVYEPGTEFRYSDLGPIVLALVVEAVTGESFEVYTKKNIFDPLGMSDTGFRSVERTGNANNVVPTELDDYYRHRLIQGVVHDETAYLLGGVAGHAGLFSTVDDLSRFAFMMTKEGRVGTERFLKPETIRLFTRAANPEGLHSRALGWDTHSVSGYSSAGRHFGRLSYGHTGFTGTSIWIEPDQSMFVILLTNRVYPTRENNKHIAIRPAVVDLAFEAIRKTPVFNPVKTVAW